MKCIKCGTEFNEGIFCPECGHKYDEAEIARLEKEKKEQQAREKAEKERLAKEKAEKEAKERAEREAREREEREAREKAERERIAQEKNEAEERRKAEEERKAKERAEEEKRIAEKKREEERLRKEKQEIEARTFNGTVYADKEEAALAKSESEQIEILKQKLLSTKKQDERRQIIADFGEPPKIFENQKRYEALKIKAEMEPPKSVLINWIYGITVLVAFVLVIALNSGAVYNAAMVWAGFGIWIWVIWKIVLVVKSKKKDYYLNIKHI